MRSLTRMILNFIKLRFVLIKSRVGIGKIPIVSAVSASSHARFPVGRNKGYPPTMGEFFPTPGNLTCSNLEGEG